MATCTENSSGAACQKAMNERDAVGLALATGTVALLPGSAQVMWGLGASANAGISYLADGTVDPAEREKVQQKYDALLEKDIASDKEVIAACSNGNAGSSACASARLKVIASKEGYEDGPYNSKYSQQYADAYGLLPALVFPERAIQLQLVSGVVYAGCVQGDGYCSLRTALATQ